MKRSSRFFRQATIAVSVWLTASTVGGFFGAAALGWFQSKESNWNALSALATSAAVTMALVPIWSEWVRRNAQAYALRAQLIPSLAALSVSTEDRALPDAPDAPLNEMEKAALTTVESLIVQAHILEKEEMLALAYVFGITRGAHAIGFTPNEAKRLQGAVRRAVAMLRLNGATHARRCLRW